MKRPIKILWIEILQGTLTPTPITDIPEKYHSLIIPYAKAYYSSDSDCDIISQCIRLFGMSIWIHDVIAWNDIILAPTTPRHILVAHVMLQDSLTAVLQSDEAFDLNEEEGNFFSLLAEAQTAEMNAGQQFRSFHVNIYPEFLPDLAQRYPLLAHLAQKPIPWESAPLNFTPFRINAVCEQLRLKIEECTYLEKQADYFLTRTAADLIGNFVQQDIQAGQGASEIIERKAAENCFRLINTYFNLPLSINLLASKLDVPRIILQQSFQHVYGISIPDYLHMVRMMKAYELILESAFDFQLIAEGTGFSDVAALTDAFEKYYGEHPVDVRSSQ